MRTREDKVKRSLNTNECVIGLNRALGFASVNARFVSMPWVYVDVRICRAQATVDEHRISSGHALKRSRAGEVRFQEGSPTVAAIGPDDISRQREANRPPSSLPGPSTNR